MSDSADRTIPATPRRRESARRQGFMPMASLPAWVATVATTLLLLPAWAEATFAAATAMMQHAAGFAMTGLESPTQLGLLPQAATAVAVPTLAVVAVAGAVGLAVRMLLDGPAWRPARLVPTLDRISLLAGLTRIFSTATLLSLTGQACGNFREITKTHAAPVRHQVVCIRQRQLRQTRCQHLRTRGIHIHRC